MLTILRLFPSCKTAAFLVLILILTGCAPSQPVRVGLAAELTGKQSELGINLRNGVQLAVEEINKAGGINGRSIDLRIEDDFGTAQGAKNAENKLIDSGVVAIVGHLTSNITIAGFEVAQQRGVVLFSGTASASALTGKKDFFFRTTPTSDVLGSALARYVRQQHGFSRTAIIYDQDNNTFCEPFVQGFSDTLDSLGGQVVRQVKFSGAASPDFAPLVDELRAAQPDNLLIAASPASAALIAQQVHLLGWMVPMFGSSWSVGVQLIQDGGKAVEGMEMVVHFDLNSPSPALQAFKTHYQERFAHPPVQTAMYGYESMQMLAAALKKTGGNSAGLPQALIGLKDFNGLVGPLQLDEYGDVKRPMSIQRIVDQKFVTVEVINP